MVRSGPPGPSLTASSIRPEYHSGRVVVDDRVQGWNGHGRLARPAVDHEPLDAVHLAVGRHEEADTHPVVPGPQDVLAVPVAVHPHLVEAAGGDGGVALGPCDVLAA